MAVELKIPQVGESITEVQVGEWLKSEGDTVAADEPVVVIETDKVTVELPAPSAGKLSRVLKHQGEAAEVGEVIGYLEAGAGEEREEREEPPEGRRAAKKARRAPARARDEDEERKAEEPAARPERRESAGEAPGGAAGRRRPPVGASDSPLPASGGNEPRARPGAEDGEEPRVMPAARRALAERDLSPDDVDPSGPGGRILKEDVEREGGAEEEPPAQPRAPREAKAARPAPAARAAPGEEPDEEIVPMSPLRRRIAERLVQAQRTAAILTTFNEIDMGAVSELRRAQQERFQERHGVKLGFMSFFVKAAVEALKLVPQVNAEIRGHDIVYKNHYDIGIAVGGGKGLVVPVLRGAERLGFAEIEKQIADLAKRAQANQLALEELQGGTFTISNGGIYGSLLSTPILNPPQSGILGLHVIQDRPVAREGQVAIRPMMYVALSYDHRLVDGREAVTFLKHVKECVEEPARILIEA
ncbi:MAG TPA: 2-oxoglutarate dehydrogenase complex dihydrolipoyllysine-residue succinyltransferase [Planctomycetota bacterium]|nr:2-oxoglutarate dehydrogenase complex dihydrolipoyllysine-residue succinyltransferase [Planctomycetota bacterium]